MIKIWWFFKQQWIQYFIAITLVIIANFLFLIPPKFIGNIIDHIRSGDISPEVLRNKVIFLTILSISLYFIIFSYFNLLFGSAIVLEKQLKDRLFKHLTKMNPTFFKHNRSGELMALFTNDVSAIMNTAGGGVLTLVNTVIGAAIVIVAMIVLIDFRLMLAVLIPLPILAYVINRLGEIMRSRFLLAQESFGHLNNHALESISGLRVLRSYVQEERDIEAFNRITIDVMKKNMRVALTSSLIQPATSTIVGLSYAIGIGYGSYLIFHNQITLGQLITFNIYLGLLIWPMILLGEFINTLKRGTVSLERLENAFIQQPDVVNAKDIISVSKVVSIEMKELSFRYPGSSLDSLHHISLRIEKGQTIGIVGKIGSGKSTLLKQLLRQYPIESHKLFISEVPIEKIALEQVRKWVGYVPQEHLLLSRSLKENITMGKPNAQLDEIQKVIGYSCFTKDVEQMRLGLDTVIGESGVMLSGGQKQRTAIARALLVDPEILILDDVLSALDAKTESEILHNIRQQRQGKTTLIATHRLSAVSHSDWILVMDNGKIIEEGTHDQLLYLNGWYKQQFDRQQMEAEIFNEEKESNI